MAYYIGKQAIEEDTRTYQEYVTPTHVVENYKMASKLQ